MDNNKVLSKSAQCGIAVFMLFSGAVVGYEYANDESNAEISRLTGMVNSYEEFYGQVELERQERIEMAIRRNTSSGEANTLALNQTSFCEKNRNTRNQDLIEMMARMCD